MGRIRPRLDAHRFALDVLPRFKRLADHEIQEKAPGDLVTIADIEAEARLMKGLGALTPGADFIAEEEMAQNPIDLEDYHSDTPTWLIDPVDGTRNFSRGETPFAIVVAYVVGGIARNGWIYLPAEESMIVAERGEGAFEEGERLRSTTVEALDAMTGMINYHALENVEPQKIERRARVFAGTKNWRCAAYDFTLLARGTKHFSLYRRLWPWDHAAGGLIFEEAGGHCVCLGEHAYSPLQRAHGLLCAPSPDAWHKIHDHLATGA